MNPVRAALLGLATLAGSGCFTARPPGSDRIDSAGLRTEKAATNRDGQGAPKTAQRRADEAWEQVCRSSEKKHGDSYGDGFRAGFVDRVEGEGTGEPPYLPPFHYLLTKYFAANGSGAIEMWYAGFRHGAEVARTGDPRQRNDVPAPGPAMTRAATPPPAALAATRHAGAPAFPTAQRPAEPETPSRTASANAVKPGSAAPAFIPATLPASAPPAPNTVVPAKAVALGAPGPVTPASHWSATATGEPTPTPAPKRPPVVVLDRGPAAAEPPAAASNDEFSPWLPSSKPLPAPTIVRDP